MSMQRQGLTLESKTAGDDVTIPEFEYLQFFKNYNKYVGLAAIRADELLHVKSAGYLRDRKLILSRVAFSEKGASVSLEIINKECQPCGMCVEVLSPQQLSMTEWVWADYLKEQGKWRQN